MRQSLMRTFDDVYVLDLHGNAKKKEAAPDGSKDENVFDIQQGVAIGIFVKRPNGAVSQPATVRHADLWGVREVWERDSDGPRRLVGGKYATLYENDVESTDWTQLEPASPFYLFVPQDGRRRAEYEAGWSIAELMPVNSVGIVTARDKLTVQWTQEDGWKTVLEFAKMPTDQARERFDLGQDVEDWKVHSAQEDLRADGPDRRYLSDILYRPFDRRATYFTGRSRGFICRPRAEVMRHMRAGENLGLMTTRLTKDKWDAQCTRHMIGHKALSAYDITYLFPLYLYPKNEDEVEDLEDYAVREEAERYGILRKANLAPAFIEDVSRRVRLSFLPDGTGDLKKTFGPEDVFHYIYAVFHSPMYRERYAAFLKIDFPRVPLTSKRPLFRKLCGLGARLVKLHLIEDVPEGSVTYPEAGDNRVDKPRYVDSKQRVYINDTQYFGNVPAEAWGFHVGGYQVCRKWLKDRKGRQLTFDDRSHYMKAVSALVETLRVMNRIDGIISRHGGWPLARPHG